MRIATVVASIVVCLVPPVTAQTFPTKTVRIVVPFPAGGGLDFTTRIIARKLSDAWGQTVLVDNRPGASGMIGAESVVRAAKDGYTLLSCSPAEVALNVALYPKMTYDPMRELAPITLTAIYANVIAVHASVPANNWKALVALSKRTPGGIGFGSSGTGSTQHLTGEWLKRNAGIHLLHVPYRGAAPATADLVGGQIAMGILGAAPLVPHIQAGRLRALAVTTEKRAGVLPDVPTLAEVGVKGFTSSQWFGFLAPAGTPRDVIAKINADVHRVLASAEVKERLATQGGETYPSTPEAFAAFMKGEHDTYAAIITAAAIKVD